ncbi:MAG: class I poly(R)-hydroxyalkanoic acid synthase [Betaproteobacteria bacterium]|nr:MAG: class I poly(R)-hydroxyalkanoic acid synthase [Betaproteobacteria bacterium]
MADQPTKSSDAADKGAATEPNEVARTLAEIALRSDRIVKTHLAHQARKLHEEHPDEIGVSKAFADLATRMMSDPYKLAEAGMKMWQSQFDLWQSWVKQVTGAETTSLAPQQKSDPRFRSDLWNNWMFDYIRQAYLVAAEDVQNTVAEVEGLDQQTARKVQFFTKQYVDALAPSNFVLTNPDVLKATIETGGKNLLDGLNNLLNDIDRGQGKLAIKMVDNKAFKMGENVATTPGKVVFQTELMQLIQYEPTTPDVYSTPLLIVPPWINKYYILDLRQSNSFIKWAVDQGITVFVISWVNPDEKLAEKTFDDYLIEGPLAAMDAVKKATGEESINLIGYCLGGTLAATALGWLRSRGQADRVKSATFFTTMIDFEEPGELGVFVDEGVLANLEKKMQQRGFLEGSEMASTFNLLRANDLVWSFVVNNYLLGREPMPFDLLYWNSDATRMPARMHTFYLRHMYIRNELREPGGISLAGEAIDLSQVETPSYFISTLEDHIAPWKSTYAGAKLFKGPVKFVLGGSGHIAGIVNPPKSNKYWYWTNPSLADDADGWLEAAEKNPGSWWNDWLDWIAEFGGKKVPARKPGDAGLKALEDAPGSYASFRLDTHTETTAGATPKVEEPSTEKPAARKRTAAKPERAAKPKKNAKSSAG